MAKIIRTVAREQGFGVVNFKASNSALSVDSAEKDLEILADIVTEKTGELQYVIASSAAALPALSLAASKPYQVFRAMALINPVPSLQEGVARLLRGKGRHLLPLYDTETFGLRAEIVGLAILVGFGVNPAGPAATVLRRAINSKSLETIASEASAGFRHTPMLYILGGKDSLLPPSYPDLLSSIVPHARITTLAGLDHALSTGTLQTIASRWPSYRPRQVGPIAGEIGNYFRAAAN